MTRPARKYVLDTQLFINAFRDPVANEALQRFHRAFSPFEHLSVIVAQELRAGVKQSSDRKALERNVLRVFERAGRTITPSADAWHRSGDLLGGNGGAGRAGDGASRQSIREGRLARTLMREAGCVLVTENDRDFLASNGSSHLNS